MGEPVPAPKQRRPAGKQAGGQAGIESLGGDIQRPQMRMSGIEDIRRAIIGSAAEQDEESPDAPEGKQAGSRGEEPFSIISINALILLYLILLIHLAL